MDLFNCMDHDRTRPLAPESSAVYIIIVSAVIYKNLSIACLGVN
jgi:hypothetical protein